MAKFKEMNRRIASGDLAAPAGPCRLCGDPGGNGSGVIFEYHDEDYGHEYSWLEPAAYMVCRDCHIYRIHQRTARRESWLSFLAHVRRGGYARETRNPQVKAELESYRMAMKQGKAIELKALRAYPHAVGDEWFARLSMDSAGPTTDSA